MATVLSQMMDRDDMRDGGGSHWWWLVAVALLVVLVVVVVWLLTRRGSAAAAGGTGPSRSAEDVLAERLARGEIDEAEFRRRRDALRE